MREKLRLILLGYCEIRFESRKREREESKAGRKRRILIDWKTTRYEISEYLV